MKKGILSLLTWSLPLILLAQTETSHGINWTQWLTWEQVKEKAKAEKKYIFLDCYATWCGPCKMMDRDIYASDTVASYFKEKFISVKVQMDKTKKDNELVQSWYKDAAAINETYHIEAYPTFLFFNPDGIVSDHQMGYKGIREFLSMAQTASVPGKVYNDPYEEYNKLVASYRKGNKDYDKYPQMIIMANKTHDDSICHQLLRELSEYVITLKPKERYTKERIQMWDNFTFRSDSHVFQFFYKDGKLIDKVADQNGYANNMVDKTIWTEFVVPFLVEQAAGSKIAVTGGYITDVSGKHLLKTDSSEADWKKLKQIITQKFNSACAERNILAARIEWYTRHWNYEAVSRFQLVQMNKYWTKEEAKRRIPKLNNDAFNAFLHSTDKTIINGFIMWLEKAEIQYSENPGQIDTYANLLYKAGRTSEAIEWENRACLMAPGDKDFKKAIEKMKKGEPTYGAVWASK